MKKTVLPIVVSFMLLLPFTASADIFLVTPFQANSVNPLGTIDQQESISFNSGGLTDSSGTIPVIPLDNQGEPVFFTVGYPFAATAAFVADDSCDGPCSDGASQLTVIGDNLTKQGADYRYNAITGQTGIGEDAWDICFTGVRDLTTGNFCLDVAGNEENYTEDDILEAEHYFRGALSINPYNTDAAKGLLNTYYERMAPLIFAGNASLILGTRARLEGKDISEELALRREAEGFFNQAVEIFIEATGLSYDMSLLDGSAPYVDMFILRDESDPTTLGVVPLLIDAYTSALSRRAETIEGILKLEYMNNYTHPVYAIEMSPERQAIIAELQDFRKSLTHQSLIAAIFADLETYQNSDIGSVSALLGNFDKLAIVISKGHLFFTIARDVNGDTLGSGFSDYSPEYVPFFFDPYQFPEYTNSFALLLDRSVSTGQIAQVFEDDTDFSIREFDNNQTLLDQRFEEIRTTYEDELTKLCGQKVVDSVLVPDFEYFMLPPEERLLVYQYNSGIGESKGSIYEQYLAINLQETALDAAILDLENLEAKLGKHEETAQKIAGTIDNLADFILQSGDQLAALEYQVGELHAARFRAEAKKQKKAGVFKIAKGIGYAVASFYTGGATSGQAMKEMKGGVSALKASAAASSEADFALSLAAISAQKEKIRAMESAQVQFQRRDELLLKTEEEVFGMMLDAERLKLNILIAEQRMDMEIAELGNLLGRVAYLAQESGRATALLLASPLANPHFRMIHDEEMRKTDALLSWTREKTYLAAMAAAYKINNPAQVSTTIKNILKARNVPDLTLQQASLESLVDNFYLTYGTSATEQRSISLRHYIVQNNYVVKDQDGYVDWTHQDTMLQEFRDADGNVISSDQHWLSFLQSCLTYNPQLYNFTLTLPFSTSLNFVHAPAPIDIFNNPLLGKERRNPLFDINGTLMKIVWVDGNTARTGVKIDFIGPNLSVSSSDDIKVDLKQEGASYMRSSKWSTDTTDASVQVWNLEPVLGRVVGTVNGIANSGIADPNSPQFHERSPANDRWTMTLEPAHQANNQLIGQLGYLTDIVITFSVEIFTPASN